ncbi:hypothetical protein V6N13_107080 [Hibiscus sabdariffa]
MVCSSGALDAEGQIFLLRVVEADWPRKCPCDDIIKGGTHRSRDEENEIHAFQGDANNSNELEWEENLVKDQRDETVVPDSVEVGDQVL